MEEDIFKSKHVIEEFMKERGIQGTLLFSSIAGDVEYNLELDGDPREYYGVFVAPTEHVLSLLPPSDTLITTTSEGVGVRLDEIKKWCKLVQHGSPKAIETLYARPSFCYMSPAWRSFVPAHRRALLARTGIIHLVGYAKSHVFRREKKKAKPGDTLLLLYQILRLLFMAELMINGDELIIYYEPTNMNRQFLLDLKIEQQGDATRDTPALQQALKRARELVGDLDAKLINSPLPERVNVDELDEWFYGLRLGHMTA